MTSTAYSPVNQRATRSARQGAMLVEFALVVPLLFLTVFAFLEIGRALMTTHSLEEAARSGCRVAVLRGATSSQIRGEVDRILAPVSISTYTVQVQPIDPSTAPRWAPVTVTVTAAYGDMSWLPLPVLFSGKAYSSKCTLPKEYSTN